MQVPLSGERGFTPVGPAPLIRLLFSWHRCSGRDVRPREVQGRLLHGTRLLLPLGLTAEAAVEAHARPVGKHSYHAGGSEASGGLPLGQRVVVAVIELRVRVDALALRLSPGYAPGAMIGRGRDRDDTLDVARGGTERPLECRHAAHRAADHGCYGLYT